MNDMEVWRRELIDEVRTIANREMLERLWSGVDPHEISSYAEEVAHVFDDYDIDGFLSRGIDETGLTHQQVEVLRRFRDEMAGYVSDIGRVHGSSPDHNVTLSDPRWDRVIKLAQELVASLEKNLNCRQNVPFNISSTISRRSGTQG